MNVFKEKRISNPGEDKFPVYDSVKGQTAVSLRALEAARERERKQREDRPSPLAHHPLMPRIRDG